MRAANTKIKMKKTGTRIETKQPIFRFFDFCSFVCCWEEAEVSHGLVTTGSVVCYEIGYPQFGQILAMSEISFLHSGQLIKAIFSHPLTILIYRRG